MGQGTQNVATSQPSSLARMIGTWLNSWRNAVTRRAAQFAAVAAFRHTPTEYAHPQFALPALISGAPIVPAMAHALLMLAPFGVPSAQHWTARRDAA